uniref:Uncharacterized protein n=1 Tax=Salmo trutta TaxID=8032 RepID=A0A674E2G2_SALTR
YTHTHNSGGCEHRKNLSPLLLCQDEFGEIGVQLILLVNALLLDAVPALLLGYPEGTGNVVAKVQPLLFRQPTSLQVADGFIVVLHLQVTLTQEEEVSQGLVVLLQLHVAQWVPLLGTNTLFTISIPLSHTLIPFLSMPRLHTHTLFATSNYSDFLCLGVKLLIMQSYNLGHYLNLGHTHTPHSLFLYRSSPLLPTPCPYDGFAVAGGRLLVLAAEEEAVALLLPLLR